MVRAARSVRRGGCAVRARRVSKSGGSRAMRTRSLRVRGLEGEQAPALGAGEAELLVAAHQVDLAVEEAVIVVLAGGRHEAEFAVAADLQLDPPAALVQEEPARVRRGSLRNRRGRVGDRSFIERRSPERSGVRALGRRPRRRDRLRRRVLGAVAVRREAADLVGAGDVAGPRVGHALVQRDGPAGRPPARARSAPAARTAATSAPGATTASKPAATRPSRRTTCIAFRQASRVRLGWIVATLTAVRSTGSTTWSGSAAVSSAIDFRQYGQAPS